MWGCARVRPQLAVALLAAIVFVGGPGLSAQDAPLTTFRSSRDVISIDVVVRDRAGAIVSDLTAADFEIREDGRLQDVLTTSFEQTAAAAPGDATPALQRLGLPPVSAATPATATEVSGRRLMLLLFDLSAMEHEEVQRGVQAALQFVDSQMTNADLVAVASLTWQLTVLTDFTGDRESVRRTLEGMVAVDVSTGVIEALDGPTDTMPVSSGAPAVAATDTRLRAIRLMADALAPIPQKKALLYFTAGLANAAQDTPAELRLALTAASRANLAIYPVDTRGLQAVVPSGPARVASRGGEGLFSGRDVDDQFNDLTASQDMMASMASATGGRMFSGSNDVSAAFQRVQQDTAAYYLLGYSSTNTLSDGKFRRVQVRVRRAGLRVEARAGYYADRDFAHTNRSDREALLEERLLTPDAVSAFEVGASANWRRTGAGAYQVSVTLALPASVASAGAETMDLLAVVEDEDGRPLARVRDLIRIPAGAKERDHLAYTTTLTLPSGHFNIKAVVRENGTGETGSVSTELRVPDLQSQSLALSPAWFSRAELGDTRSMSVEVYDSQREPTTAALLVVTTALFVDDIQVFEGHMRRSSTAMVNGSADLYQVALPAAGVPAGRYLCQTTVVDPATGRFAILRNEIDLR